MISRTHRAIWTYFSSLFQTFGTVVIGFVTTPLILHYLGKEGFGAFKAASDWVAYISLLEFGLSGALMPILARKLAKNDSQGVSLTMAVAIRAYIALCILMVLSGLCLVFAIPDLVHVSPALKTNLQWGVAISLLGLLLLPLLAYQVLSQASQRGYLANGLLFVQSLSISSLSVLFAWWGFSVAGQFLAILLGSLPYYLGMTIFFTRLYPNIFGLVFSPAAELRSSVGRELWKLNWPIFIISICGRISLMTDNIIVAGVLGSTTVASFVLTQRLSSLAFSQFQGISASTWPGLVDLYHKGQTETLKLRLVELTKLTSTLGVAVMVPVTIYNSHFVALWVGGNNFAGQLVTVLSALNNLMLAIFSLWTFVLIGIGNVSLLMPIAICSAIVNFLLSLFFTFTIGVAGPLVGTFIGFLATYLWWLPWLLQKKFGISAWSLLKSVGSPFLVGIPFGIFFWYSTKNYYFLGWFGLAIEMILAVLLYLALSWLLLFSAAERTQWSARLRMLLPKKKP